MIAKRISPRIAAGAAGLGAAATQAAVLRETLSVCSGFELAAGLVLFGWLVWTGAGSMAAGLIFRRARAGPAVLGAGLILLSLLIPAVIGLIRYSGPALAPLPGEIPTLFQALLAALLPQSGYCLVSGGLFAACWSAALAPSPKREKPKPHYIYLFEAAGAALGGLGLTFVLLPLLSMLQSGIVVGLCMSLAGAGLIFQVRRRTFLKPLSLVPAAILAGCLFSDIENRLNRAVWGERFIASADTNYQSLAMTGEGGKDGRPDQISLFSNRAWLYSLPDPQTAEYAVHAAMLQHPRPGTVLMIGGDIGGMAREIFKYKSVTELCWMESDQGLVEFIGKNTAGGPREQYLRATRDKRVQVVDESELGWAVRSGRGFDLILMNQPDPVNIGANRFYTREFFSQVKEILNPDGVFCFGVTSSPLGLGAVRARLLASLEMTLEAVFPATAVIPGARTLFLAAKGGTTPTMDPAALAERIKANSLDLTYFREYYLFDLLNPFNLNNHQQVLETAGGEVNRDFQPVCHLNGLILWAGELDMRLSGWLLRLSRTGASSLFMCGGLLAAGFALAGAVGKKRRRRSVDICVLSAGFSFMLMEMAALLAYQILAGSLYSRLALIIGSFMAGLAVGSHTAGKVKNAPKRLRQTQLLACLAPAAAPGLFWIMSRDALGISGGWACLVFSLGGLACGGLAGAHFIFALRTRTKENIPGAETAGLLYGLDLLGAGAGALAGSVFIIPVFGLNLSLWLTALLSLGALLGLSGGNLLNGKGRHRF